MTDSTMTTSRRVSEVPHRRMIHNVLSGVVVVQRMKVPVLAAGVGGGGMIPVV